jgi:SAM-dependent methyltransferase
MGSEAQKTNRIRGHEFTSKYFSGDVLDIGCGADLVTPAARPFDIDDGDANEILKYLQPQTFDCVHSSHCLEHMRDVPAALSQWWALVRPGGYLVIVVPHEDLYEQYHWPSIFNSDHKATFRLDTPESWSPVSFELRHLVQSLPLAEIVDVRIQDVGYDYSLLKNVPGKFGSTWRRFQRTLLWIANRRRAVLHRLGIQAPKFDRAVDTIERTLGKPVGQTDWDAVAQIQAIVRKRDNSPSLSEKSVDRSLRAPLPIRTGSR